MKQEEKDELIRCRERGGISIMHMARKAGVGWQTIRDWETGERKTRPIARERIENAYKALIDLPEKKPESPAKELEERKALDAAWLGAQVERWMRSQEVLTVHLRSGAEVVLMSRQELFDFAVLIGRVLGKSIGQ